MKTLLMSALYLLIKLFVLVVLPLVLLTVASLLRFTVVTVLPTVALFTLAVASGITRTFGVGLFGLGVVLRLVMATVDRLGMWVPAPRLPVGVGR